MRRPPRHVIALLTAWDTCWKAVAVWRAFRNKQYRWMGILAVSNTVGILPIVYLTHYAHTRADDEE